MKRKLLSRPLRCIVPAAIALVVLAFGCAAHKPVNSPTGYDVIIIGAGMGGLSAATHLALNGLDVLVLEQHDKVGGCATNFKRGEFTFDASLHEMPGGGPGKHDRGLYKLLEMTGVTQKVEMIELPHFYRSVYPGVDVTLPSNWDGFKKALKQRWPEEAKGIDKFHELCSGVMNDFLSLKNIFRHGSFRQFFIKSMVPIRQSTLFAWKDKTFKDLMDHCFENDDIKAVVSQLWVYYGPPVPEQSALISMAATEAYLSDGVWHIKGTSQALSDAYAQRIRELGGEIRTDTLVTEIVVQNGVATGVRTQQGDTYRSRYVVSNTDPYQMVYKLVGEDQFPSDYIEKLEALKPANSLYGVYMGLNIDLKKLGYHDTEIFYNSSKDSTLLHKNMTENNLKASGVAITIYSNYNDPIYAPPGKSAVVLNTYSGIDVWPEYKSDAYYKMKNKKAQELINLAANVIPELANHDYIEEMDAFTPHTIQRYTLNKDGIAYGFYLSPSQWRKIPNNTPIDNLFIASNWSRVWHGIGAAQVNGWRAARLIMDRENID